MLVPPRVYILDVTQEIISIKSPLDSLAYCMFLVSDGFLFIKTSETLAHLSPKYTVAVSNLY